MAKKNKENDIVTDGSRAITKFHVSDVVMVVILVILCATCVVPFIHLLAKSVSSNTAVLAKESAFGRLALIWMHIHPFLRMVRWLVPSCTV